MTKAVLYMTKVKTKQIDKVIVPAQNEQNIPDVQSRLHMHKMI